MDGGAQPNIDKVLAQNLVQIYKDETLKLLLQEWEKNFKLARDRVEKKKTRSFNVKNEMYQLIGFYSVFQGVVLTAVAQSNTVKCHTSWGPASLSVLASIATLFSVHSKLNDYKVLNVDAMSEEYDAKLLYKKIALLKERGAAFDFASNGKTTQKKRKYQQKYYWPIMIFLFLFSFIVCSCCFIILCWQNANNFGD